MVVRLAAMIGRPARRGWWSLPCAMVLLVGTAILPARSSSISLLSPGLQLRAIGGLAGGSPERALAPSLYGNFAPSAGSSDPVLSFDFGWNANGPLETQVSGLAAAALLYGTTPAGTDAFGITGGGPVPTTAAAAPGPIRVICEDDKLARQLQAGGQGWNTYGVKAAPVQFASGVFTGSGLENANPQDDPTRGPSGDPSNLLPPGAAGGWCRPRPVPFSLSSPLASRVFWMPVVIMLVGVAVFLLSRGVKMPTRSDAQ